MTRQHTILALAFGGISLLLGGALDRPAYGHGSLESPVSRVYSCFLENPESPDTAVCKEVVRLGGTQPLYDWMEVNIANANNQHRSIIPDGKLCSAGRDKYAALNLPRTDWATTKVTSGGQFTFRFKATAPHRGFFEFYMTRPGYNPAQPLRWADLDALPFLRVEQPVAQNGLYTMTGQLPIRTGRHLIYVIWQRTDSPEAFYTCSDVNF